MAFDRPTELVLLAAECGVVLDQPCGGTADCGSCRVRLEGSMPPPSAAERLVLTPDQLAAGWRLGCRLVLTGDATVDVVGRAVPVSAKNFGAPLAFDEGREPVDGRGSYPAGHGVAIDLGTTTLAVALVGLATGDVDASLTGANPQVAVGADVMTRIARADASPAIAEFLTAAVRAEVDRMIRAMMTGAGLDEADVHALAVVGNPTMVHLWLGLSVSSLGQAPFEGAIAGALETRAGAVCLAVTPETPVYVLPGLRCHVGADAMGAAVAVGLDRHAEAALLIDLGTNSEIVLAAGGRLFASSTAAGPAFEGRTVSCGMRAEDGAIDSVRITDDGSVVVRSVGHAAPRGFCGSGLMDAVAELLSRGVVASDGRMRSGAELKGEVLDRLGARVREGATGRGFTVVECGADGAVVLLARDVREVQLAVAAIRAGVVMLGQEAGITPDEIGAVYVAGNFGNFVRKTSLLRLGLLPIRDPRRVHLVGNAAGLAARLALLDARFRRRVERAATEATYVELGGRPDYGTAFVDALEFPAAVPR